MASVEHSRVAAQFKGYRLGVPSRKLQWVQSSTALHLHSAAGRGSGGP